MRSTLLSAFFALAAALPATAQEPESATLRVTGVVVEDDTGNPIAGATVELLTVQRGRFRVVATHTTEADGAFAFEDVEPGQIGVRVRATGRATFGQAVVLDEELEPMTVSLARGLRVTGRLVDETTGRPVAGGRVVAAQSGATSDENGWFEIDGLPRQVPSVALTVRAGDYLAVDRVVPNDGGPVLDAGSILLRPGAAIDLKLRSAGGDPVAGASGLLYPLDLRRFPTRGSDNVTFETDEEGRARIGGLSHDRSFALRVRTAALPEHVVSPVRVPAGTSEIRLDLVLTEGVDLPGRVVSRMGEPIGGVRVHLAPVVLPDAHFTWNEPEQEMGWVTTTDPSGRFVFEGVAFGTFRLDARGEGLRVHRRVVHVHPGEIPGPMQIEMRAATGLEPEGVPWVGSLAEALDLSRERNLPVFIFMTMDGEVANEYMAANTYRQPWLRELAQHTVPVVSSTFEHPSGPGGKCAKFGSVTCIEHIAAEGPIAELFLSVEFSEVPQHIFLRPSGELIERRMFYLGFEALRNMIMRAIRVVNPERALRAAAEHYEDVLEPFRYGSAAERAAALRDLLVLADNYDEVARTALLAIDPSVLSPEQERAVLDRFLPGASEDRAWFVTRLLLEGSPALRVEAVRRLRVEEGDAAFSILVSALGSAQSATLRARIEEALGVVRTRDEVRFPGMTDAQRREAALALARQADPAALPALFECVRDEPSSEARTDCVLSLVRYPPAQVLPFLVEQLERGGPDQAIVARAIGELGDPRGRAALRRAMGDPSVVLRVSAARSLGLLGDAGALPLLRGILSREDLDDSIRVSVASALLDLGVEDGIPLLIELADHPVHGPAARARLREAHSERPPRGASEWRRWWEGRGRR